jgi:sugar lactone lactonase YvrE
MGDRLLEARVNEARVTTIAAHAAFAVHHGNAVTGECPYWDAGTGKLWWIDVQGQRLLGCAPSGGEAVEHALPSMPGLLVGRRAGGLLLGLEDGLYPFDPANGLGARLVAVEADDPATRINDGKPDAAGRLWFGTMDKSGSGAPVGALYRLNPDGALHRMRERVRVPNGIEFSPDGTRFHFCDTRSRTVEAMDYDVATGTPGTSREFARFVDPILPDGACVDSAGGYWIALIDAGRVERFRPDGTRDLVIELPVSRPTMPMLGGPDGRTLYVTSQRRVLSAAELRRQPLAGDLLAVRVPHAARAPFLAAI